jgi:hypothetical protein
MPFSELSWLVELSQQMLWLFNSDISDKNQGFYLLSVLYEGKTVIERVCLLNNMSNI